MVIVMLTYEKLEKNNGRDKNRVIVMGCIQKIFGAILPIFRSLLSIPGQEPNLIGLYRFADMPYFPLLMGYTTESANAP